jgi:hypothetical protein
MIQLKEKNNALQITTTNQLKLGAVEQGGGCYIQAR